MQVISQGGAFVVGSNQVSATQFGNHQAHKFIHACRGVGGADDEAIAGVRLKPFLNLIGNLAAKLGAYVRTIS